MSIIHTVTFEEVRSAFIQVIERGSESFNLKISANAQKMASLRDRWISTSEHGWFGASPDQMIEWLRQGYDVPGLKLTPELSPMRKRKKIKFSDFEGDYQHDLFLSGFDQPFMYQTPREVTPAMDFEIDCSFSASISNETLAAYTSWCLKALIALQTSGIACDVWISVKLEGLFQDSRQAKTDLRIKVADAGQALDFKDWSAIFSPGGFRILCFQQMVLMAEEFKKRVNSGLGRPVTSGYKVNFRNEDRVIHVQCGGGYFDSARMDEDFRMCLELAKQ